ncbi:hypothetical protein ACQWKP_24340, partial [Salmonella enterica subsp. enterica serovar Infantis]
GGWRFRGDLRKNKIRIRHKKECIFYWPQDYRNKKILTKNPNKQSPKITNTPWKKRLSPSRLTAAKNNKNQATAQKKK